LTAKLQRLDGPIDLVGHDWGGGHVCRAVAARPDLVRSWATDIAGCFDPEYVWHERAQVWQTADAGEDDIRQLLVAGSGARAALLESLELAPARVVANSYGGNIALRLAAKRPELFRSLSCHEPPLWELLADDPEGRERRERQARIEAAVAKRIAAGEHEGAARQFVDELAFGPGAWENQLPPEVRAMFVRNAPTFLDELQDPDVYGADLAALAGLQLPVRVTQGTESPPEFGRAIDRLVEAVPQIKRETLRGAGHVPQLTMPAPYAETITAFADQSEALGARQL
jgi:pimeloyl-ACP methyl ester carboxylesterase